MAETNALGSFAAYLPMLILLAAMYFVLILPQKKQQKQRKELLDSLKTGDEVVTIGGILGRIKKLDEETVLLELSDHVEVRFLRSAVARKKD
ncbi:MAG: preprotein translocase subunit YajC [Bacillota bacterium]|jgi:preprotein translocase subunit YajC|nr:preprotein translocase subunit YajC [Bacillota bacterium]NLU54213.1 preprotein translocase subunit YajC [Bacillota bacterium]HOA90927.1 preprotein translocase subunit YajC [Bacillota bacterium]HOJ46802.1 preprotein translocase subunit YajC [Bacillota bacterium]HOL14176.1 preprotein translocase subunit YajC [Bacillota bacterium]